MNSLKIGLALSASLLAACGTAQQCPAVVTPAPVVVHDTQTIDTGCDWVKPVTVDLKQDVLSAQTGKEILEHNREGVKHCGWGKK